MINHITLIGRLTRDPGLKYTQNGVAVGDFDLAVDREVKSKDGNRETDFIRIVTWQKQAEHCANYLKKGRLVAVEGRLQIRTYEATDGQKRRVAEVVANRVQFLERADTGQGGQSNFTSPAVGPDDFGGINLDDLPF